MFKKFIFNKTIIQIQNLKRLPVKLGASCNRIVCSGAYLGLGLPLGGEAPALHINAGVVCTIYLIFHVIFSSRRFPWEFNPSIVILAYSATVAVAFQSAVGGAFFFLEEFLHYTEQTREMVLKFFLLL